MLPHGHGHNAFLPGTAFFDADHGTTGKPGNLRVDRSQAKWMTEYQIIGHGLVIPRRSQAGIPRNGDNIPPVSAPTALPINCYEVTDNAGSGGNDYVRIRAAVHNHKVSAGIDEILRLAGFDRACDLCRGQPAVSVNGDHRVRASRS